MKKVKILTITLLIIVITMIAFWGVYIQKQNRMENMIKDYDVAMDLKGSRNIRLEVNQDKKTVMKDAEGKNVENSENLTEEQMAEKGYKKEEIPNNTEEVKTIENYKKSKEIMEKRLEKLKANNYMIRLEEQTGDIIIELTEDAQTDHIISNVYPKGKFEIIDSQTKEVLMNNSDVKQARVMYGSGNSTTSKGTSVYLEIEFNKEGRKKLEEISGQYVKIESNSTEETTEQEITENEDTIAEKKVTMKIDDEEIMSTSFEEPVRTGKLQLSFGVASTDKTTLQAYEEQAYSMASLLNTGNLPIQYDLSENQYILSDLVANEIAIAIYVTLAILIIAMLVFLIRYKKLGALGVISYIGFISLFTIVIRYANVVLSVEGIFGMIIACILNYILLSQLLEKVEDRNIVYQNFFIKIIPIIIMVITFCFIRWVPISSFGMSMFWGIALIAIYNTIVTNGLLKIQIGKEK